MKKACFLHLGLPFFWFLQCPEPISPNAPPQEPGCPTPPSGLGLWVGKHSSASGISPAGSSRKSELERESLTLDGCSVTKQDQSSGELAPWSAGDTPLTSAHLDFGTWVSEAGEQGQVKGKETEEDGAGEQQEQLFLSYLPRPCF